MTITKRTAAIVAAGIVLLLTGVVTLVLTVSSGPTPAAEPATFTVNGSITVMAGGSSSRGFNDIHEGAQVEVTNERNEIIAVGSLQKAAINTATSGYQGSVAYPFTIQNVPLGQKQYGVHVGNENRGVIWKPEVDARTGFELTLSTN